MQSRFVVPVALAVTALIATGCAEDRSDLYARQEPHGRAPAGGTAVNGVERAWLVGVDLDHVKAGPVIFTFKNVGTQAHEMLVVKTDLPAGELPVDPSTRRFNEESSDWQVIDEISEYEPGEVKDLTVDLAAGKYQLVCNIAGHYQSGMVTAFEVDG